MHSKKVKGFFITGTDTGVGKTTLTRLLIAQMNKKGLLSIGCKPISCGDNNDTEIYLQTNPLKLAADLINPIHFPLPASPHIAAKMAGKNISLADLVMDLKKLFTYEVEYIFVEGIGGWKVPINKTHTTVDLAKALGLPIILVVGIRVGCLNHASLTWDSLSQEKMKVAGWIANVIEPCTPHIDEHVATLCQRIKAPYLGTVPYQNPLTSFALDVTRLINDV